MLTGDSSDDTSTSYNVPINHTEKQNSIQNWDYQVYASSSIGFMGATWIKDRNVWEFTYRMAGTGSADGFYGNIRVAIIEIEGTQNVDNMAPWSSTNSRYIGSASTPNTSTDYTSIANAVIGYAITAINSMGASFAWSTLSLIRALGHDVDGSTDGDHSLSRLWRWSPDQKDVGQFFWFVVDVDPNETVQFSYEYMLVGPVYELLSAGKGYRTLSAGPPDTNRSLSMNPEEMTFSEREQCGIETIPRKNLMTRAAELNIPEITIERWLKTNENVFYYAHDFVEYETPQIEKVELTKSTLTKDLLLNELSEQIDRSKKIIKAFSTDEVCDMEDSIVILNKHKLRLTELLEMQTTLEKTPIKNIGKLNTIYDSYCRIVDE